MGCGGSKEGNLSMSTRMFLTTIRSKPELSKFGHSLEPIKTLLKTIASPVFGGSVLNPVGKLGGKRTKLNPLEEQIKALSTEDLFGDGYYELKNIRESEQT